MSLVLSNWKRCSNPEVLKIYQETIEEAKSLQLLERDGYVPPLYEYGGTKPKNYGVFRFTYNHYLRPTQRSVIGCTAIGLHKFFFDDPDTLRYLIQHEVAHYLMYNKDKQNHGHDTEWLQTANKLGEHYGFKHQIRANEEESLMFKAKREAIQSTWKYEIQCPKCHKIWRHQRICGVVKSPSNYTCSTCGVSLIRTK